MNECGRQLLGVPGLCSDHWLLLPFSSSPSTTSSLTSQPFFALGRLAFLLDSGCLHGSSAFRLRYAAARSNLVFFVSFLWESFQSPPHGQRVLLVCLLLAFAAPACFPLHPHNPLLFSLVCCDPQSNSSPQASVASPPFQVQVGIFSSRCFSLKRCLFSFRSYHWIYGPCQAFSPGP